MWPGGSRAVRAVRSRVERTSNGWMWLRRAGRRQELRGRGHSRSVEFLGFWPEHLTDVENSRSLREPVHSIPLPTIGEKNNAI